MELTNAKGRLVIIGGGEDKEGESTILKEFLELTGKAKSRVVVITAATDFPAEVGAEMIKVFERLGVEQVKVVDISSRADSHKEESIEAVNQATGLYFTGGNQLHITSLLGGTPLQKVIFDAYEKGLVIAGTSAGAAMMANSMILGGDSEQSPKLGSVEIGPGMDLVKGSVIDTHFSQRGRHGRLLTAVAHFPQELGIGIDEDTALIVEKGKARIVGSGGVTIIDAGELTFTNMPEAEKGKGLALANVKLHVLPEGHQFDLIKRSVIIPKDRK